VVIFSSAHNSLKLVTVTNAVSGWHFPHAFLKCSNVYGSRSQVQAERCCQPKKDGPERGGQAIPVCVSGFGTSV